MKRFQPIMQTKHNTLKESRYNSVQRSSYAKSINEELRQDARREQKINESSRIGNYANIRRNKLSNVDVASDAYYKIDNYVATGTSTIEIVSKSTGNWSSNLNYLDLNKDIKITNTELNNRSAVSSGQNDRKDSDEVLTSSKLPRLILPKSDNQPVSEYTMKSKKTLLFRSQPGSVSHISYSSSTGKANRNSALGRPVGGQEARMIKNKFEELMSFSFNYHKLPISHKNGVKHKVKFRQSDDSRKKVKFELPKMNP